MPENRVSSGASSVLFKTAAVRGILQPQGNNCIALENISNKTETVSKAVDMLQQVKRPAMSKNMLCLGSNSTKKDVRPSEKLTPTSSSHGISPHPEFKNFLKYKEPEKISPYSSLEYPAPAVKSQAHSCCRQPFVYESPLNEATNNNSAAVQYTKNLFLLNNESYFDSHCHIDFLLNKAGFRGSFTDFKEENRHEFPPSFAGCIAVFCNPHSFKRLSSWGKHLEDSKVWASFGCHPKNAAFYDDVIEKDLIRALQHPKVRALGEIGLDYSERSMCPGSHQKQVFRRQLRIARARNLPVVIHCRDAHEDCFDILKEELPKDYMIHLHCFTDTWNIAKKFINEFCNLFIGLTNLVTFPSAVQVHEVAKKIPLSRLLLETDAPYFVPTPLSKNVKFAHPGMAIFVADKIASIKGAELRDVVIYTRNNAKWVYGV